MLWKYSGGISSHTKCSGNPGIIHDSPSDCHPVSWAWMTSQLNVVLFRKLHVSVMCLALFDMLSLSVCAVNRSTSAGIKCLYCIKKSIGNLYDGITRIDCELYRESSINLVNLWQERMKAY